MNIDLIREKYARGEYTHTIKYEPTVSSDHIFDEELSVRRNREMAKEHNERVRAKRAEDYARQGELDKKLATDVTTYITDYYGFNEDVASKIQMFCYQEKHDNIYSYFDFITTIADFVDTIINPE